jgi:hypothetical protein
MTQRTLRIPGALKHTSDEQTDASLQGKAREHADRHPGMHFLADVLRALHGPAAPLRNPKTFFSAFAPRAVMEAFGQRPDLRVKPVKAIVGGPPALLRRLTPEALASQIDLLVIEDLPEAERSVRADADRPLPVTDIYFKYVDPLDLAVYFSAQSIWGYESQDEWWKREPSAGARALMAAELRSIRCHAILTDSEIIDLLGDETIEGHLPLAVRTELRRVARRAAAEGRPFTDTDLFASGGAAGTGRDLIDEMVESVPLTTLRDVVNQVIALLGLADSEVTQVTSPSATANDAGAIPIPVNRARSKPRSVPMPGVPLPPTKTAPPLGPTDRRVAGAGKSMPQVPPAVVDRTAVPKADLDGPPQPDDDFALFEEVSGRI